MPIVDSINKNLSFEYIWNFSKEIWIKRELIVTYLKNNLRKEKKKLVY